MRVVVVSAEVAPFAKTGGLGDVAAALGRYLHEHDHDVRLFLPLYGNLREGWDELVPVEYLQDVPLRMGPHVYRFSVHTAPLRDTGLWAYFIACGELYGRKALYTLDWDEHIRMAALSRAALECCQRMGFAPDVVHCNDWHTALIPLYLKVLYDWDRLFANTRTVLTIHNLAYQGGFPSSVIPDLGLEGFESRFEMHALAAGRVGFLKTGILYADAVNAVSETYAREIQTPEHGFGLDGLLRARSDTVFGITNGVDYEVWSPDVDPHIAAKYTPDDLSGKAACKEHLLTSLGLPHDPDAPVVGVVSRLSAQKGLELGFEVLPQMLAHSGARLVVLGSGDERLERFFASLQRRFPDRARFVNRYDNALAHQIEAGADMFLMPSLFEPCGLNQMYSLRYGTVPIVRRTGGLADTVTLWNPETGEGTGFVFDHFTTAGLWWALDTALTVWQDRDAWRRLQQNGMSQDFSWHRQIERYVALYRHLHERG
jgi:starch synthase